MSTVSVTGEGSSTPIPVNTMQNPFNASVAVIVSGTVSYTVEHTFNPLPVTGTAYSGYTWWPNATLQSQTANNSATYNMPITAIRVTNLTGSTGVSSLTVVQAGARV